MDTLITIDWDKCQRCGLCVEACEYKVLYGGKNYRPDPDNYNPPCNICDEPCKKVCYYGAIDWERW